MMILHKNSDPRNLMWLPIGRRGINTFWTVVSVFTCATLSELIDVLMSAVAWAWGMRVYFIADEAMILMCADLRGDMIIVTKRIIKSSEHLLAAGTNFVDNNLEQSWCLRNILNLSQRKIHPSLTFKMSSLPFDDSNAGFVVFLPFSGLNMWMPEGIFGSLLMWEFNNRDNLFKGFC